MIGEDAYTPGTAGDALRYLDNTHRGSQPDHMSEYVNTTSDNGGVHTNSGIPNYAFYLLAKGGTHHLGGSMTGIGADAAAAIFYKALTTYMTSSTDFAGARTATLNAAAALYGSTSTQYTAVQNAWGLCGVGSVAGGGGGGTGGTERISNGGFETSVSPWVQSGTGALYVANGNYPQAGTGYIYFGNANSVTGTTYQQITIPAGTSPTLSFYLNVTSAETTTTTAYDKMSVEVRNSAGTLLGTLATYSNLNKVATAGSYSQKSFSLAAYAGQTIRVQFSSTTDSSAITTFRVDTVSVK
jgi:Zn-dependent metalloprotease